MGHRLPWHYSHTLLSQLTILEFSTLALTGSMSVVMFCFDFADTILPLAERVVLWKDTWMRCFGLDKIHLDEVAGKVHVDEVPSE